MRTRAMRPGVIFTALTLVYLLLGSSQLIEAFASSGHDDALFLNLAIELLSGRWLGHYNNLTLTKGPVYPLFIALSSALGVPLLLAEHALYAAACLLFVYAIRGLFRSAVAQYILYALLLFNPASWGVLRVLREGIYPALTLLVLGTLFGLLLRRNAPGWQALRWSVGFGIVLGAFWLTREEGVWILPAVALVLAVTLFLMWRERPVETRFHTFLLRRASLCVVPLVLLGISIFVVAGINRIVYGVFTSNEFQSREFTAAYGALSRVDPNAWQQYVPVPERTRMKIYAASPAFAELKPYLEGRERGWTKDGCAVLPSTCGDFAGGWFMWALRDSVRDAGYYRSAPAAARYYARLADEVNRACDRHALSCGPPRQTMQPPWRAVYAVQLLPTMQRAAQYVIELRDVPTDYLPSNGAAAPLEDFRSVTRNPVAPVAARRGGPQQIVAWAVDPQTDAPVQLRVIGPDGQEAQQTATTLQSPDVHDHILKDEGKDLRSATQARVTITAACESGCRLVALEDGKEIGGLNLANAARNVRSDRLELFVESVGAATAASTPIDVRVIDVKSGILNRITTLYRALFPALAALGLIATALAVVACIRGRRSVALFVVIVLGIEGITRLVLIALVDVTSFPAIFLPYLSPTYPLFLAFAGLALIEAWDAYRQPALRLLRMARVNRARVRRADTP